MTRIYSEIKVNWSPMDVAEDEMAMFCVTITSHGKKGDAISKTPDVMSINSRT